MILKYTLAIDDQSRISSLVVWDLKVMTDWFHAHQTDVLSIKSSPYFSSFCIIPIIVLLSIVIYKVDHSNARLIGNNFNTGSIMYNGNQFNNIFGGGISGSSNFNANSVGNADTYYRKDETLFGALITNLVAVLLLFLVLIFHILVIPCKKDNTD